MRRTEAEDNGIGISCSPLFIPIVSFFLVRILVTGVGGETIAKANCPGLTLSFNGVLTCSASRNVNPEVSPTTMANSCEGSQSAGTTAKYKCGPHFKRWDPQRPNHEESDMEGVSICTENGTWSNHKQFQRWRCVEDCGRREGGASEAFITHGKPTTSTSWPWHATIFRKIGNKFHYICGGTVIRRTAVLTAAHCIPTASESSSNSSTPDSLAVVVGAVSSDFSQNVIQMRTNDQIQIFEVKRTFISESYDARKDYQGDIAILELSSNIDYSNAISPACLPNEFLSDFTALEHGLPGNVIGFGADERGSLSNVLRHGLVQINSYSECFLRLRQTLSESQFCAGGRSGDGWVTVCSGDSGGGLHIPSVIDEKFYVHGIVSTGDALARRGLCQNYGVFTRVHSFIPWIHEVLNKLTNKEDMSHNVTHVNTNPTQMEK